MRSLRAPLVAAASLLAVAGLAIPAHANAGGVPNQPDKSAQPDKPERRVCAAEPAEGFAACDAHVVTKGDGVTPDATNGPTGYSPAQLKSAYNLDTTLGAARTIAIVDAYDDPNAATDLAAYRSRFGLPACGVGCFTKYNQYGQTSSYPTGDVGWAQEISLDLDMASATCPLCNIALVEAKSASFADLGTAVNTAAAIPGVVAISNSYGGREFSGEAGYEGPYNHPGIAVTVSSGDAGYGVEFPASSRYVTAVGGTSLKTASNSRGWTETAWSKAGSGCSAYIPKPAFQHDTGCSRRTVADVSAVADPYTGVSVYDSYGSSGANWYVFGGTSVSSPIIAGVYALAGHTGSNASFVPNSNLYTHVSNLFDVVGGKNGNCKKQVAYLCTGLAGYDGPTGLGTPNGTGAF